VRIVDRIARPKTVPKNERWIRVDLDRQTLTAYEGEEPVFTTLVSSGLPDHATPTGIYRLHAEHVTATMADNLAADGPYSIEDVPWTMYFLGSYALHAAFWHDRFGHQRSHGCVNLAPRDARWLFFWTAPNLPSAWHGILAAVGQGTTVVLDTGVPYEIDAAH
jgi:lipoprotein-anchoring transpeptidase ErfK/SrfK